MEHSYSVVIPVYQGADTLTASAASALSLRIDELIIVDDGSTDGTASICAALQRSDTRVRVLRQKNQGAAVARREGARQAKGEYLLFLDADDRFAPNLIDTLDDVIDKTGADLIQFSADRGANARPNAYTLHNRDELLRELLTGATLNSLALKCVKRELTGLWNAEHPRLRVGEDLLDALPLLWNAECFVVTDQPLYHYSRTKNSASAGFYQNRHLDVDYARSALLSLLRRERLATPANLAMFYVFYLRRELDCAARAARALGSAARPILREISALDRFRDALPEAARLPMKERLPLWLLAHRLYSVFILLERQR